MGYIIFFAGKLLTSESSQARFFQGLTRIIKNSTINYKKKCYHIANDTTYDLAGVSCKVFLYCMLVLIM